MLTSFVLFTTMLTACGDKSAATPSAAADSGPKVTMAVPEGGKAFVSTLTGWDQGFEPTDADGASFMYTGALPGAHMDGSGPRRGYGRENGGAESGDWSVEGQQQVGRHHRMDRRRNELRVDKGSSTRAQVTVGSSGISGAVSIGVNLSINTSAARNPSSAAEMIPPA